MATAGEVRWDAAPAMGVLLVGAGGAAMAAAVRAAAGDAIFVADGAGAMAAVRAGGVAAALVDAADAAAVARALGGAVPTVALADDGDAALDHAFESLFDGVADVLPIGSGRDEFAEIVFNTRRPGVRESSLLHGPRLAELSAEVARIAKALDGLAQPDASSQLPPAGPVVLDAGPVSAGALRGMIRARRARTQYFPGDLFADPAWDILLDLMAARLEGKQVSVSSLCIAAAVPATTALRWIKSMTDAGLLERRADPADGRRVFIDMSDAAATSMRTYLAQAPRAAAAVL